MKLLNVVRRRKPEPVAAPPPAPKRPPLPAKLLAELVGLEAMRSRRLDDRRRRPRLDLGRSIVINAELTTGRQAFDAQVLDMSAEGVAIEMSSALATGTRFRTTMPRLGAEGLVTLAYTVRRCEPLPDGRHHVGGELLAYLD
ncbi:MAG: PilZ domain-containing protein [Tepidisphaeraceae bacterium]